MSWGDFKMLVSPWPSRKSMEKKIKKIKRFLKISFIPVCLKGKHTILPFFFFYIFTCQWRKWFTISKWKMKIKSSWDLCCVCVFGYIPSNEQVVMWLYNTRVKRDGKISISSLLFCLCVFSCSFTTNTSVHLF